MAKRITYDIIVNNNLDNCFNENGEITNLECYQDPDNATKIQKGIKPIILFSNPKPISVYLKSDGLVSIHSIKRIPKDQVLHKTDKELYFIFRHKMENCLQWPSFPSSINQKRSCLSGDCIYDRIDLLLSDISKFYGICQDFQQVSISSDFINRILSEISPYMQYAFLTIPTLVWLCQYKDFNAFIKGNMLECFVDEDEQSKKYIPCNWGDTYYKELYERTIKYREDYKDARHIIPYDEYFSEK